MGIYFILGIITCHLIGGQTEVADQELEFLKEVSGSTDVSPYILYLCGILGRKQGKPPEEIMSMFNLTF